MGEISIGRIWAAFLHPLFNQRGEVALEPEPKDTDDDPGEPSDDDPEPGIAADGSEPALKDSEDTTPQTVPYTRFKEVNEKAKAAEQAQTKLEHFKRLGPESYYKLYPDEMPGEDNTEKADIDSQVENLVVKGGQYNGKTINEVFNASPAAAMQLVKNYYDEQDKAATADKRALDDSQNEIVNFANTINKEFNGADSVLTKADLAPILKGEGDLGKVIQQTLDWMKETGRGYGNIIDGYNLMTMNDRLKGKAGNTLKSVVNALKSNSNPSISAKQTSSSEDTGFSNFANMSASQAANELENMTDAKQAEFLKKAPASVRKKFPNIPWD